MPATGEMTMNVLAPDEHAELAFWLWEMRGNPEDDPQNWFWADEELKRTRRAAGYEPEDAA